MERNVDPTKDSNFFANACQVCRVYGKDAKLKRCSQCKSMVYCSREHQIEHWPHHKEFCRVLRKAVKTFNTIFGTYKFPDGITWKKARIDLLLVVTTNLNRDLSNFETEQIMFPRSCEICHITDPRQLSDCPDCPDASFCIEHPRNESHSATCEASKLHFETNTLSPDFLASIDFASCHGNSAPRNMNEAVRLFLSDRSPNKTMEALIALLSEEFTKPYTFFYAWDRLPHPKLSKITIHIIVQNDVETDFVNYWHSLLHHNLPFKKFKIFLVGLELSNKKFRVRLCAICRAKNCKINVETVGSLYTDFVTGSCYTKPDYIVGFNLALLENDPLLATLRKLSILGCTIFITTFNVEEMERNREIINSFLVKTVEPLWVGKNPFSSLKPHKEFEKDGFFYHNQYLIIYEKLA